MIVVAVLGGGDGQVHVALGTGKGPGDGLGCAGGAVFSGEQELLAVSPEGQGVGQILKYVEEGGRVAPRYSVYM